MMAELARWLSRLPIIRHARSLYYAIQVARHYALWQSLGYLPVIFPDPALATDESRAEVVLAPPPLARTREARCRTLCRIFSWQLPPSRQMRPPIRRSSPPSRPIFRAISKTVRCLILGWTGALGFPPLDFIDEPHGACEATRHFRL
jgi:hypothetical protein